jgi:hypothetical protein
VITCSYYFSTNIFIGSNQPSYVETKSPKRKRKKPAIIHSPVPFKTSATKPNPFRAKEKPEP